jgi:Tfp pilus assembly protein PilF
MRNWVVLLLCMLLSACANTPVAPRTEHLFKDYLFSAPSERISADDVFALNDQMKHYLRTEIAGQLRAKGPLMGLVDALYGERQLKLEYDSASTRNASQAFDARSGNCLSLVIMTAAFAKQLRVPVRYQTVFVDETWSRNGDISFLNGHVNLTLGKTLPDSRFGYNANPPLTIDFLPPEDIRGQRTQVIPEETIVAMYMNNRAAEFLALGRLNDAYWWAREAIGQAPTFLSSYNTLGVIYLRHGNLPEAEQVLDHALQREPENPQIISNLARVLNDLGRVAESQSLSNRLAKIEPYPPFHFFNLGLSAMRDGNFKAAKELFTREVNRAAYNHEFHFWLALANFRLGDIEQARKHLTIAMENSTTRSDHDLYAAKLDRIRSLLPRGTTTQHFQN